MHIHTKLRIMCYAQFSWIKKLPVFLFLLFISKFCFSQNQQPYNQNNFWNNVRLGGGLGLGFTNSGFNASVAPSAIYLFNNQFAAGASLSFNYAKYKEDKRTAYGGSILSLYNPIPFLQLSTEYEQLRVNHQFSSLGNIILEENYWSPALFIGLGYTSNFATIGIRYDILFNTNKSTYASAWMPFVRFYF